MKNTIPNVEQLNVIQDEWMKLDPFAPEPEKKRVFKLMDDYPKIYVSGNGEFGTPIFNGSIDSMPVKFTQAMERVKLAGGRTDVYWNGTLGKWMPC